MMKIRTINLNVSIKNNICWRIQFGTSSFSFEDEFHVWSYFFGGCNWCHHSNSLSGKHLVFFDVCVLWFTNKVYYFNVTTFVTVQRHLIGHYDWWFYIAPCYERMLDSLDVFQILNYSWFSCGSWILKSLSGNFIDTLKSLHQPLRICWGFFDCTKFSFFDQMTLISFFAYLVFSN